MTKKISSKKVTKSDTPEVIPSQLAIAPRTRGRPTLYKPEMCETVVQVAMNGGFHAAMMLACGISETQFYEWKNNIPEFKEAVHHADLISLAKQEDILQRLATGEYRGNVNAVLAVLNNKWKAQYSRSATSESTEITINNNTLNLTSEQVSQKISEKLEKMKRMGLDFIPHDKLVIDEEEV